MVKLSESIVYSRTKSAVDVVKKLNLWGCEIDNIDLCARMVNLQVLSLSMNKVSCLEPLRHCVRLEELYLRRNQITSLNELEHLRSLKCLRTLWIDENPCTVDNSHRTRVLQILPELTRLDDKPVTVDDLIEMREYRKGSGEYEMQTIPAGGDDRRSIVDTVMPNSAQLASLVGSHSMGAIEERSARNSPCRTMHASMYDCILEDEQTADEEDSWHDFSMEEQAGPTTDVLAGASMFQSLYEGSQSARQSRAYRIPLSLQQRSVSLPRRRLPSASTSPVRRRRVEKIMSAINVLLDELDADGLRRVVDEAQRRIKKQR